MAHGGDRDGDEGPLPVGAELDGTLRRRIGPPPFADGLRAGRRENGIGMFGHPLCGSVCIQSASEPLEGKAVVPHLGESAGGTAEVVRLGEDEGAAHGSGQIGDIAGSPGLGVGRPLDNAACASEHAEGAFVLREVAHWFGEVRHLAGVCVVAGFGIPLISPRVSSSVDAASGLLPFERSRQTLPGPLGVRQSHVVAHAAEGKAPESIRPIAGPD